MRYLHVLAAFASMTWALEPIFLRNAASLLLSRAFDEMPPPTEGRGVSQRRADEVARSDGAVGILPLYGVMSQRMSGMQEACEGGCNIEKSAAVFRHMVANDDFKAIVLNIDSPGGNTNGIAEFAAEIRSARGIKPIIAQIDSLGASAAYWIASAADEIAVTTGGLGGSIGVYSVHEDISAALEQKGVKPTLIKAGQFKAETNPLGPLSAAGREMIQARVDEMAYKFRSAVAENRGVTQKAVIERFGDGKVFGAEEMVERGMADKVATLGETVSRFQRPTKRQSAAADSRQAFARGEIPGMRTLEQALGDLGLSNRQAELFVKHGYSAIAQGDPGTPEDANVNAVRAFAERLSKRYG